MPLVSMPLVSMPLVSMSLGTPPEVVAAHRDAHGQRGDERYRLRRIWCLQVIEERAGELWWEGRWLPLTPGCITVTAPDVEHCYRMPARTDFSWIHLVPDQSSTARNLPVVSQHPAARDLIRQAVTCRCPAAARALAWAAALLLAESDLASIGGTPTVHPGLVHPGTVHPGIRRALAWAEARIERPLTALALAQQAGLSVAQLNRAWHHATGRPAMGWVRERRLQRALHLLRHGGLGCPAIATRMGFADVQHLNKALRQRFGRSPRTLRDALALELPDAEAAYDVL